MKARTGFKPQLWPVQRNPRDCGRKLQPQKHESAADRPHPGGKGVAPLRRHRSLPRRSVALVNGPPALSRLSSASRGHSGPTPVPPGRSETQACTRLGPAHRGILGYSLLFKTAVVDLLGTHADFTSNTMLCTLPQGVLAEMRGVQKVRTAFITVCLHSKPPV